MSEMQSRAGTWVMMLGSVVLAALASGCPDGNGASCDAGSCTETCTGSQCEESAGNGGSSGMEGLGERGGTGGSRPDRLKVSGRISASVTLPDGVTELDDASFAIEADDSFSIQDVSGSIKGTAARNADGAYSLSVESADGRFGEFEGAMASGRYVPSDESISLSGSSVSLNGLVLMTAGCPSEVTKTAVYFTHGECETAEITVEGVRSYPIHNHYHEGGLCDGFYDTWREIGVNDPSAESVTFCNDLRLLSTVRRGVRARA